MLIVGKVVVVESDSGVPETGVTRKFLYLYDSDFRV